MDRRIEALKRAMEYSDDFIEDAIKEVLKQRNEFDDLETEITIKKTGNTIELSIGDIQGSSGIVDFITIMTWALATVLEKNTDTKGETETAIDMVTDRLRDMLL